MGGDAREAPENMGDGNDRRFIIDTGKQTTNNEKIATAKSVQQHFVKLLLETIVNGENCWEIDTRPPK